METVFDTLALIGIENDRLAGSEALGISLIVAEAISLSGSDTEALNDIDWLIGMDMLSDSE